jgi:hypothetical protein
MPSQLIGIHGQTIIAQEEVAIFLDGSIGIEMVEPSLALICRKHYQKESRSLAGLQTLRPAAGAVSRSRLASAACPLLPRRNADITINAQITGLFNSIPPMEYDAWLYDVVSPIMISLDYNCLSFYIKK